MADFNPGATILPGGAVNVAAIPTEMLSLACKYSNVKHTSSQSKLGTDVASPTFWATVGNSSITIDCEDDEVMIALTTMNVSHGASTGNEWQFRHNISGETLSVSDRAKYRGAQADITGKLDTITFHTIFSGLSGSKTVIVEWGNGDYTPSNTIYSHVGQTSVFLLKKRS